MDHAAKIKKQAAAVAAAAPPRPPAAAAAQKKPTTLLDAYEVECIRRELERLVLKHNHRSAASGGDTAAAPRGAHGHGHRRRHDDGNHLLHRQRVSSARKATTSGASKRVSPSPSLPPAGPKTNGRRGVRLLGRHAVAICSGSTAPVASTAATSGRGRRAVAICSGAAAAAAKPVSCSAVGVGRRRPPVGGYREVEKV